MLKCYENVKHLNACFLCIWMCIYIFWVLRELSLMGKGKIRQVNFHPKK